MAVIAAALSSSPAASDLVLSAAAGGFVPWKGESGYSLLAAAGFTVFSDRTRLAAEFEYRSYDVKVSTPSLGIHELPVDTYDLRAVFRLVLNPGGLTPYLGLGGGLKLVVLDNRRLKIAAGLPPNFASTKSYGIAGGLLGLIGVEWPPFNDRFSIYAEARAEYSWEFTDGVSAGLDDDSLGGFTGMGGVRFAF